MKDPELQKAITSLAESARISNEILSKMNDEMHEHSKDCAVHFTQSQDNFNRMIDTLGTYSKLTFFALALAGGAFGLKEVVGIFIK